MQELFGFYLIAFAITLFVVCVFGVFGLEFSTKDKLIFSALETVILGILSTGIYLLING